MRGLSPRIDLQTRVTEECFYDNDCWISTSRLASYKNLALLSFFQAMFNGGQYIIAVKRLSKESRQGLDEFMNASKMHCEASTSKPHKASGILQRARREDFDL